MKSISILCFALYFLACTKNDKDTPVTNPDGATSNNFSKLYAKMYNYISIDTSSSDQIIIKTNDVPDHKSPFFPTTSTQYEAYNGDNAGFSTMINLNGTISDPDLLSQTLTFKFPRYPVKASIHAATTGGPIGIARNGIAFFNQYNGAMAALDDLEINNADQYLGHPTPSFAGALYHYHYEPVYLTKKFSKSSFVGFLIDGFPVYGPIENGQKITQSMLDEYNGHISNTEDYPTEKIYHYHTIGASSSVPAVLKTAAPYINGGKYYGTKGTVN